LKLTTDRHGASCGLFATAELDSPVCDCGVECESVEHFLLRCPNCQRWCYQHQYYRDFVKM